jgi:hypothetical protein
MQSSLINSYQFSSTQFFRDTLALANPPIFNVNAVLIKQELVASRRRLQGSQFFPLVTVLQVTGKIPTTGSESVPAVNIDDLLVSTVNENEEGFRLALNNTQPEVNQLYFKNIQSVLAAVPETPSPAAAPTELPTAAPTTTTTSTLSSGAIAGIAVGGAVVLALMVFVCYDQHKKNRPAAASRVASHDEEDVPVVPIAAAAGATAAALPSAMRKSSKKELEPSGSFKKSDATKTSASDVMAALSASAKAKPPPPLQEESESMEEAGSAYQEAPTNEDSMSYAYSLDAGNVTEAGASGAAAAAATAAATGKKTKTVTAPAGKLGIVIDTTLEGPVVHKINPGSPLDGLLTPGDLIIAINDTDTRAMSAANITSLMVKTANQQRILTVLTEED